MKRKLQPTACLYISPLLACVSLTTVMRHNYIRLMTFLKSKRDQEQSLNVLIRSISKTRGTEFEEGRKRLYTHGEGGGATLFLFLLHIFSERFFGCARANWLRWQTFPKYWFNKLPFFLVFKSDYRERTQQGGAGFDDLGQTCVHTGVLNSLTRNSPKKSHILYTLDCVINCKENPKSMTMTEKDEKQYLKGGRDKQGENRTKH